MVAQPLTACGGAGSLDHWVRYLEIGVQEEAARDDQGGRFLLSGEGGVPRAGTAWSCPCLGRRR